MSTADEGRHLSIGDDDRLLMEAASLPQPIVKHRCAPFLAIEPPDFAGVAVAQVP